MKWKISAANADKKKVRRKIKKLQNHKKTIKIKIQIKNYKKIKIKIKLKEIQTNPKKRPIIRMLMPSTEIEKELVISSFFN